MSPGYLSPAEAPGLAHDMALRRHEIRTTHAQLREQCETEDEDLVLGLTAAQIGTSTEEVARVITGAGGEPESDL